VDSPHAVHNTYLEVLAELGSVGLVAFAAVVVASVGVAFRSLRAFARDGKWELEMLTRGLMVGIFGVLGGVTFVSAEFEKQLWLLLGLAAALSSLADSRRTPAEAQRVTASGGFLARSEIL
jgi:O-antigen ligase